MLISGSNTHEVTHGNKSSDVLVIPAGGQVIKIKARKPENTMKELVALGVIKAIFLQYPSANIDSPLPISVDLAKNSLTMSYVPGVNGEEIMSANFRSTEGADKRGLALDFVEYIGRIIRIKEDNGLAHHDFQLRHLVYEEASERKPSPQLYLIDVENAQITNEGARNNDQFKYFDTLIRTLRNTELQIASRKETEPNLDALAHLDDVIAPHPLIRQSLMQEHLNLLDQLFSVKPFLFQPGEKHTRLRRNSTRVSPDNRPLSIYHNGDYPKNTNHTFHPVGEPKVSGSRMREAYDFLDRLIRGYDSIHEDPVDPHIILSRQQELQKQFNTDVSIIN
jgi:hypothetical protein